MDFGKMAQDLGLEADEFCDLVRVFIEATTSDLEALESAVSAGAAEQALAAAHSIKGAAASLGFDDASLLAKKIEMNAKRSILQGSLEDASGIRKEMNTISVALEENHCDEAD